VSRVLGRPGLLLWLTAVWVALWGSLTAANVLGGLLLAAVLLALPLSGGDAAAGPAGLLRPGALLRFVGAFAVDLVRASLEVVALVLRPRVQLRQAVVAVPVTGASDALLTVLANSISLTPGTLTLEVDRARGTLYVHVLQVGEGPDAVERVRRDILALERRAIRAVGSADARAAVGPGGAA
jgi:multicomponent Na+:H+ antiporter subunit E